MTDTSTSAAGQAADKASTAAATATGKATHAGTEPRAPLRDAPPGGFGGLTMIKDRVAGVVRRLTGGS
jgi:hypothetical protein